MTRLLFAALTVAATTFAPLARAKSQDTLQKAVVLGLRYDPGSKPGVLVLRIAGVHGDSIRAILQRDFDNGDRINVIAGDEAGFPDAPTAGRNSNYPIYARMGAHALVQVTPTANGIHVAVHDVAQAKVARVRDFGLDGTPNSRDWRITSTNSWLRVKSAIRLRFAPRRSCAAAGKPAARLARENRPSAFTLRENTAFTRLALSVAGLRPAGTCLGMPSASTQIPRIGTP